MRPFKKDVVHDAPPWWFLALLAGYAVLELSFNHHLMQVSSSGLADLERLQDLEFWARLISGLGLAFWLMRVLLRRLRTPVLAVLLSVLVGVTLMWHVQRWLVDTIVAHGSESDKRMSLYVQMLASDALTGQVQVRGLPLVQPERLSPASRPAWEALLPAITLGLTPDDLQTIDPARQSLALSLVAGPAQAQLLADAYRRAVMVPIALGVSLLFGLANLCLLLSLLAQRWGRGSAGPSAWQQRAVFALLLACALAWSWQHLDGEADSEAYQQVARPALRAGQPLLAPFVEWSLRAEPAWHAATSWMHMNLLQGYGFRRLPVPAGFDS